MTNCKAKGKKTEDASLQNALLPGIKDECRILFCAFVEVDKTIWYTHNVHCSRYMYGEL